MGNLFCWSSAKVTLLTLGITAAMLTPMTISHVGLAQTPVPSTTPSNTPASSANLSDVGSDYWAHPFIQALVKRNIIAGFPDGTFKPDQPVNRAEFATMIQKAFNQNPIRESATRFSDVPANYWAATAIQKAYETGFMTGYPGNLFRPNQQIPKVQAIVAITNGLGLNTSQTGLGGADTYYTDASAIPNYAMNNIAAATQANLVVNYPNVNQLNPEAPLTRAEAAAILYQALVKQGQLLPLASNEPAANYIAGRTPGNTQTGNTQTRNDIVSVAASSNSLTTLTLLLKTAGLTDTLQQSGPYTVFAPTDAAFAALPPGTIQQLQLPENRETLIKILRYHVVPGQLTASQLSGSEVTTVENAPVNIKTDPASNQISVNGARVLQTGVPASNGVIYPINEVLLPPTLGVSQQPPEGTNQGGTTTNGVTPGTSTRGGSSYVGVAGNIGLLGNAAISEGNVAVISKIGLTNAVSVRPSVIFGENTLFFVPVTLDFFPRSVNPTGEQMFPISPYVGAGLAVEAKGDTNFGLLLTGGVDIPLSSRFTVTGAINAAFLNETDVGLLFGVGYNF
ncbi:MAG: S-layer homology domain-containing protein [Gloeotrichia echinulata DVL01]